MKIILPLLLSACHPCSAQQPAPDVPPPTPAAPSAAEDSLAAILKHFDNEKIKALKAFIIANPKGKEADAARAEMNNYQETAAFKARDQAASYELKGDFANALATLEAQYDAMDKGEIGNLGVALDNIERRLSYLTANKFVADMEKAKAVLEQGIKDFPWDEAPEKRRQLDLLAEKIKHPGIETTPEIAFTATDGTKVDLAAMKGKVVLVLYRLTEPDIDGDEMLRHTKAAYGKFHAKGFEVIDISLDEDKATLEACLKRENLPWPVAFDGKSTDSPLAVKNGVKTLRFNFIVGKDGKTAIRWVWGAALETVVMELLK
jgi:peroxiredoxin